MLVFIAWFWGSWLVFVLAVIGIIEGGHLVRVKSMTKKGIRDIDEYLDGRHQQRR